MSQKLCSVIIVIKILFLFFLSNDGRELDINIFSVDTNDSYLESEAEENDEVGESEKSHHKKQLNVNVNNISFKKRMWKI